MSPSGAGLYNMIFLNSSKLHLPSSSLSANFIMSAMTWDSRACALGGRARRAGRMRRARARREGAADLVGRLRVHRLDGGRELVVVDLSVPTLVDRVERLLQGLVVVDREVYPGQRREVPINQSCTLGNDEE